MLDLIQKEILATEKYYLERTEKCEKMMSEAISLRFYKKLSHQLLDGMLTKKENSEKEIESLQGMCVGYDETIKKSNQILALIEKIEADNVLLEEAKAKTKDREKRILEDENQRFVFARSFFPKDVKEDPEYKQCLQKESQHNQSIEDKETEMKKLGIKTTEVKDLPQLKSKYSSNLKCTSENLVVGKKRIEALELAIKECHQQMNLLSGEGKESSKEYMAVINSLSDIKIVFEVAASKWSQFQIWINIMKGKVETSKGVLEAGELMISIQQATGYLNQISKYCQDCKKEVDQYRSNSLNHLSNSLNHLSNSVNQIKKENANLLKDE